jgi:lauroyl/myristoyl acyltransferase
VTAQFERIIGAPYIRALTRPIRHGFTVWAVYLFWGASFCFSERVWLWLGASFGRVLSYCHPRSRPLRRRLAALSLEGAVSVATLWSDLGRRAFEAIRLRRTSLRFELSDDARGLFESVKNRKQGALVLCPHFGHWEGMGVAINQQGFEFSVVSTQGKTDAINRLIQSSRTALGLSVIDRPDAGRFIVSELKRAKHVALFMDVPVKHLGVELEFLGRSVRRSTVLNRLARLSQSPTVFVYNQRDATGVYRIYAEEIPHDVDLIKWSHDRLEKLVRGAPEQWVWLLE